MKASFFEPYDTSRPRKCQRSGPCLLGFMILRWVRRPSRVRSSGCSLSRISALTSGAFSEHHYGARILTPSPIVMASHMAAHLHNIKIAVLGPIISLNNPVRVAEEFATLDNLTQGRLVVDSCGGRRMSIWSTTSSPRRRGLKPQKAWS